MVGYDTIYRIRNTGYDTGYRIIVGFQNSVNSYHVVGKIRIGKKQELAYENQLNSNFFLTDLDVDKRRKKEQNINSDIDIDIN